MTYEEFKDYITSKCLYDAIYKDQEGREIIVMTVLDAYSMASKLAKREWVGLADEEIEGAIDDGFAFGLNDGNVSNEYVIRYARVIEAKLRSKNT